MLSALAGLWEPRRNRPWVKWLVIGILLFSMIVLYTILVGWR